MSKESDRLLTIDEILDRFGETLNESILNRTQRLREVAKAQRDLTASLKDAELVEKCTAAKFTSNPEN